MHRDLLQRTDGRGALLGAAKIERALQAEAAQHIDIGLGEMAEMIGTEDLSPADSAAILAGIAAEIAEIAGAGEIEVAGRGVLHGGSISHAWGRVNGWPPGG